MKKPSKNQMLTTFVIGGCRSGKSSHALELAKTISEKRRLFIATCVPGDDEMEKRVEKHRKERDDSWKTLEVPIDLTDTVRKHQKNSGVILVDCVTLWIANLFQHTNDENEMERTILEFSECLKKVTCPVVIVSNEVGLGIVPDNRLARLYRDFVGFSNRKIAAVCDRVVWMVAGIPVTIKPNRESG